MVQAEIVRIRNFYRTDPGTLAAPGAFLGINEAGGPVQNCPEISRFAFKVHQAT